MASSKRSRPDPFEQKPRLSQIAATEYFTDRTHFIEAFQRYLEIEDADELRVLVFYGVGGVGKSALQRKLAAELEETKPPVPFAQFNLENVRETTQAYREVLLRLRTDLEESFFVQFPNFDLCLAVILAQESGSEVPLLHIKPGLKDLLDFAVGWLPVSADSVESMLRRELHRFPVLESWIRRAGGTSDAIELRRRARQNDPLLGDELIRRFGMDLREGLPERGEKACRGVLFLDTYESLWVDREAGKASQSRRLDHWVRELAKFCLHVGVLLVICGRDRLEWVGESEGDPNWQEDLDQHLIGGLSAHDAQAFLAKCGIGPPADQRASPLQQAIVDCCDEDPAPDTTHCHPLYLALCAEIVLNHRRMHAGEDPSVATFSGVPGDSVANELALRFLKSLHHRGLEMWIEELSLTPRFDEQAALSLAAARQHNVGRADWELLTGFSFVEGPDAEGFYRLHKTMRRVLAERVERGSDGKRWEAVHRWYTDYWATREVASLSWFHRWTLQAEESLRDWIEQHKAALKSLNTARARQLLTWWSDTDLDETERRRHGDQLWAWAHRAIGCASAQTPTAWRRDVLLTAIAYCETALIIYTEADFPDDWAETQNILGNVYFDLPTGDRNENLRRAIDCHQAALRVRTEAGCSSEWGMTQNNLGNVYLAIPTGDRSENLRRAIDCYQAALRVYTEADFPHYWAATQHNLGGAYLDVPTGDRNENLLLAINCYYAALKIHTEADFPQDWALTQNNLGIAYMNLPTGDRNANLRRAIDCYQAALRVRTEADFPQDWAMTQHNLGNAYSHLGTSFPFLPIGGRTDNLLRAIDCYQAALRIFTQAEFPENWACTQNSLGLAYSDLPTGDRNENLLRAIEYCRAAQRVYTEADFPHDWARTQQHLGCVYSDLRDGDHAENLHRAIGYYQAALRVYTEVDFPRDWAETQGRLGLAYSDLPTGDRNENLLRAVEYCRAAQRVYTEADFPHDWARTQRSLGCVYSDFRDGDHAENLHRAIGYYQAALRVYTEADFPRDWAATQVILGIAFAELPTGDRNENLRDAIDCFQAALRVYTEADFPRDWAATQNNLGIAYLDLPTGDRGQNLHRAIDCCQAALRVYTEADFPEYWARAQMNLGQAYSDLPTGHRSENLRRVVDCCQAALRVYNEAAFPQEWGRVTDLLKRLRTSLESQQPPSD
ncbi:MAG: ATP-binding protein [Rhodopirellula sp.]|nr:ATP-binding protein [Rhodopirellula sp.]